jgi:hypothetical protein
VDRSDFCVLLHDALSDSDRIVLNGRKINEIKLFGRKLFQHFAKRTEEGK